MILDIQQRLQANRDHQAAQRVKRMADGASGMRSQQHGVQADRIAQLFAWADSDDPILKTEALQQLSRLGLHCS
ncbi:MAG: hypothetical protein HC800_18590 [Phormidesmis sp. RL_2_1]|nr:hypothetical protein [Phormidesmis sp. RL_2_1]